MGDIRDTALIGELRTVVEDLTRALAGSRERARQALDAAMLMQGRNVQLEERVAELEATVEALRCGDLAAYMDGELTDVKRATAFAEHLGRCASCQRDKRDHEEIAAAIRRCAPPQVSP